MGEKKQKAGFFNLNFMLMLFAYVPLATAVIVLTIATVVNTRSSLERETKRSLDLAANGLRDYYEWDIIEFGEPTYEHDYVDDFLDQDIELTLFMEDVRYMTSIKDESGNRIEGTNASPEIWSTVSAGNDYYSDDVKINGEDFFVYYVPIKGADGKVCGMAFAGVPRADVDGTINTVIKSTLIISAIVVAVFIGIVLYFSRMFSTPLKKVILALDVMADGDISNRTTIQSTVAETKQLVHSYNKLFDGLSNVISNTRNTAEKLAQNINEVSGLAASSSEDTEQISAVIEDLASGATQLANSVQDISSQMVQMDNAINEISANVDILAKSSENIKTANNEAADYMNKVTDSSAQSVAAVRNISSQIDETNRAIKSIEEAVAVITSVASQTNLLALNASIEAARAGEAGRGFAVVASEIQSLSEQSNGGANRIKEIVAEIMKQSDASVKLSEEVQEIITKEQEYISETTEKFGILNTEVDMSLEKISAIADMTVSLGTAKDAILSNISELSAISEENAASNEEASASISNIAGSIDNISDNSQSVNGMASDLLNVISFFE